MDGLPSLRSSELDRDRGTTASDLPTTTKDWSIASSQLIERIVLIAQAEVSVPGEGRSNETEA